MKVTEKTGQAPSWALPALLLALVVRGAATDAPTFPWRDAETREWLVCGQCPPGTFMLRPCSRGSPTACRACPPRHYTEFWNYLERCRYCNVICGEREEEVRPCTSAHNRACRCQPGFFAHAGFCLEHAQCPPGAGVVAPGTPSQNTQCQPCPLGTFSAGSSSSERCQPHRNCTALGLTLNVAGSSFHDALCTSCPNFSLSTLEPGELRLQPAVSGARPESSLEREALQVVSGPEETASEAGKIRSHLTLGERPRAFQQWPQVRHASTPSPPLKPTSPLAAATSTLPAPAPNPPRCSPSARHAPTARPAAWAAHSSPGIPPLVSPSGLTSDPRPHAPAPMGSFSTFARPALLPPAVSP
ncbi:tumor necrosis factor receptor superfamily member 6B isoform X2 [Loxodonta africana]|uniref:tumor necrosis factor receptor superfamily member 6B isoform X2 n=1 Tax=Loxodonta africana TaxID=9785 RepID=UPI0030D566A3